MKLRVTIQAKFRIMGVTLGTASFGLGLRFAGFGATPKLTEEKPDTPDSAVHTNLGRGIRVWHWIES